MKNFHNEFQQFARSQQYAPAVLTMALAILNFISEVQGAELCTPAMALVVSVQGVVELRRAQGKSWEPALLNSSLCPGDMIRVRQRSRAALRLSNESMLRLDQKTTLTLAGPGDDKTTLIDMFKGAIHVLTRTPKPFKVKTPFMNAGVDGTEFFIGLEEDKARLVIYEGKVSARNEYGSVILADNEAATIPRDQAPSKEAVIRPTDAVRWALYYPTIIDDRIDDKIAGASAPPALRTSIEHHRQGQFIEALSALENIPRNERSAISLTYRASLLLMVGRVDEAQMDIEQALKLEPGNSSAYALQAIIAVVQNDKEQALAAATRAVELDQGLPTARLALSYAQQAHFKIGDALESVKKAVELDPQNALAWARLAELHMSTGYLDRALEAAHQAVKLRPDLSKTRTVLGFAYLTQIDTEAAKAAFAKAIEFDQADPMPRLGMGLAKIREGDLEAGRMELEIAASLDPANSLIRSYLGKAYFEEKRYGLAGTQFALAKERDPNDPTPWLYDGIMKQTQNQPVEALRDIQKSIELNDNRAVYRSQFLLDQDQAARGSSLARIYDNLGFDRRAIMETAKSLTLDPSNHSAHRFLSDTYLNTPRYEIARVSELLQAQLLQPINVNPVQPQLAVADLNIITGTGPTRTGFNEFAPLMERNKPQFVGSGIFGSNNTLGDEAVLSALYGRASVSVGQFHYHTNGFRENNDQKHNIYNAFIQYAVTPQFNVQAEVRTRRTEHGDLQTDFGYDPSADRRKLGEDMARLGARYSPSPYQDLILSGIYLDRTERKFELGKIDDPIPDSQGGFIDGTFVGTTINKSRGYQTEAQYLFRSKRFNITSGGGAYRIDPIKEYNLDFGVPCPPYFLCNFPSINFTRERYNGYLYTNISLKKGVTATLAGSYVALKDGIDFHVDKFLPKFGLQWDITSRIRLRLAWFETVKSALIANQTLEPTQVAGFNQLFDDVNGTIARREGIGIDARVTEKLYGGAEISSRNLKVPSFNDDMVKDRTETQQETLYRAYLYWLPHPYLAGRSEFQFEKYVRDPNSSPAGEPYRIETASVPLNLSYFHPSGIFARLTSTYVYQQVLNQTVANAGSDSFVMLDSSLGYRLPNRRGILSLEGRNLLDENFSYRNINFQVSEPIYYQRFTPQRTLFLRLTLNF